MIEQSLATPMCVSIGSEGLTINGRIFDRKLTLEHYLEALGSPSRTVEAGPPAPFGHRNNQVHVFDSLGIYLTEHHATQLVESVNFIYEPTESPFMIEKAFEGKMDLDGQSIHFDMPEESLEVPRLNRDLPGEFSLVLGKCWIGVSAKGRRNASGKRGRPRIIVRVSVCF
jgi:hypothetical protein